MWGPISCTCLTVIFMYKKVIKKKVFPPEYILNLFSYVLCYVLNLINEHLWKYSCVGCNMRGHSEREQPQVTWTSKRLQPSALACCPHTCKHNCHVPVKPCNLINRDVLVIQRLPQARWHAHARKYTKEVPHDIKYQENAGSFKESDCWNKWLFKCSLNHSSAPLLWEFKSNLFKIIYSMQTSNTISVIVVIIKVI